ncbi:MAG: hypothetical protein FWG80_02815 [Alphaproteobacteria bacterium]|nr:hypothetical protein [Alphaproteobacteria bacterium]
MKIIFFDSDKRVRDFYKEKKFGRAKIEFVPGSAKGSKDAVAISIDVKSKMDAVMIAKFPNLKLIATRSTGFDHIDADYCRQHGIKIANVAGYGEIAVAEFAIGLLLALMRKIFLAASDLRAGRIDMPKYLGHDISGKTIGIFGTGAIGSHFAKLVHAFGAHVIAHDRNKNPKLSKIVEYVNLDTLYRQSDIVALNIPANADNYHIINAAAIKKMKRGVILLNVARGELIDAGALYNALLSGKVGGVAVDVLEQEQALTTTAGMHGLSCVDALIVLYNKKMLNMDNVIVTPHAAFNSAEANARILDATFETLSAFANGKPYKTISLFSA